MSKESKLDNFRYSLNCYTGTNQYYFQEQFKNIFYTDGIKYFFENAGNGAYWFYNIVAIEIKPILENDFYFIELLVNKDETALITAKKDKGEPILYQKEIEYTDCPYSDEPYKFCFDCNSDGNVICLLSEY